MKSLVVCISLIVLCGCGTQSTSPNGALKEFQWHVPPLHSVFYFTYVSQSSTGNSPYSTSSFDSVTKVDSLESVSVTLASQRSGQVHLSFEGSSLQYVSTFLNGTPQSFILPITPNHYSIERDSVIAPSGFYLGTDKYVENAALLGNPSVRVGKTTYTIMQYRSVHDLFDTIGSPSQVLDTLEADFAPDLGYFTRLKETRYYTGVSGVTIYQLTATLDSARR